MGRRDQPRKAAVRPVAKGGKAAKRKTKSPSSPIQAASRLPSSESSVPKKVKRNSNIDESSYRPKVPAKDRIAEWRSPYDEAFEKDLPVYIPVDLLHKLRENLLAGWDDKTLQNYGAGPLRFAQWCDSIGVPEEDRMPPDDLLLSVFISVHSGTLSSKTLENWLSGIRAQCIYHGAPYKAGSSKRSCCFL